MYRVLALALALVAILALVLALGGQAARSTSEGSLTIRLISTFVSGREVDRAPKGRLSKGDTAYVRSVLRNAVPQLGRPKGAVVGRDDAVFTVLTPPTALLKVQVKLPGGTLQVQGRVRLTQQSAVLAVVGGTERFASARGTSEVRDLSDGRSLNVYRLLLP